LKIKLNSCIISDIPENNDMNNVLYGHIEEKLNY